MQKPAGWVKWGISNWRSIKISFCGGGEKWRRNIVVKLKYIFLWRRMKRRKIFEEGIYIFVLEMEKEENI